MAHYMVLFNLDDEQVAHLKKYGGVDWGGVGPHSDEKHAEQTLQSLKITRETSKLEGDQLLHGVFAKGNDTIVCHTGTSPVGAMHAQILTGLWNAMYHQVMNPPLGTEGSTL